MNCPLLICPKCNSHTTIRPEKNIFHINCKCGYYLNKHITESINEYKRDITNRGTLNDSFIDILQKINKGYEHLNTYFKELKNEQISQMINTINTIESAYEESYKRNKNLLSFMEVLIDNYDDSIEMKNNIFNNLIMIYKCIGSKNNDEIIKFFNEYNIIEYKKTEEFKCIKTITEHTKNVHSLFLLKDKRVASCSDDNTIRIYDPLDNYKCVEVIQKHTNSVRKLCQLDDGTLVSCSNDKSIIIGDYTINNAHDNKVLTVIALPKNRIASSSMDKTIKIWKSNLPYCDTPFGVLKGHTNCVYSILYMKERDVMVSGSADSTLRLWDISTYQLKSTIKQVECRSLNGLYQIDDERVIVGGTRGFNIVNINGCVIEKFFINQELRQVFCFVKLRDNETILFGTTKGVFCYYNLKTGEDKKTHTEHTDSINHLLSIDDKTIASCSKDNTIKIWEY